MNNGESIRKNFNDMIKPSVKKIAETRENPKSVTLHPIYITLR
jgi:hypothetical protein